MIDKYNYNDEPSGRVDTLAMALDKCERLEKQLKIAVEVLEEFANSDNWNVEKVDGENVFCFNVKYPWRFANTELKKIEKVEK